MLLNQPGMNPPARQQQRRQTPRGASANDHGFRHRIILKENGVARSLATPLMFKNLN